MWHILGPRSYLKPKVINVHWSRHLPLRQECGQTGLKLIQGWIRSISFQIFAPTLREWVRGEKIWSDFQMGWSHFFVWMGLLHFEGRKQNGRGQRHISSLFSVGAMPLKGQHLHVKNFPEEEKEDGVIHKWCHIREEGGSDEKNHHYVCLALALGAVHKCCHFLVGRGGRPKSDQMWRVREGQPKSDQQ